MLERKVRKGWARTDSGASGYLIQSGLQYSMHSSCQCAFRDGQVVVCRTGKSQGQQRGGHSTSTKTRVTMRGDLIDSAADWTGHKHYKAKMLASLKKKKKKTGFYYVVLAGLVFAMKSRLALRAACLSLPNAGIVWFWLFWDRFHVAQAGCKLIQPRKIKN